MTNETVAEPCLDRDACYCFSHFTSLEEARNAAAIVQLSQLNAESSKFFEAIPEAISRVTDVVEKYQFTDSVIYDSSIVLLEHITSDHLSVDAKTKLSEKLALLWRENLLSRVKKTERRVAELTLNYAERMFPNSGFDAEYEYLQYWTNLIPALSEEAYTPYSPLQSINSLTPRASFDYLVDGGKQILRDRSLSFAVRKEQRALLDVQRDNWVIENIYRPYGFSPTLMAKMNRQCRYPSSYGAWGGPENLSCYEQFAAYCSTVIQHLRTK